MSALPLTAEFIADPKELRHTSSRACLAALNESVSADG